MDTHNWKRVYLLALSEQDLIKLPLRIAEARRAIFDRIDEMVNGPCTEERRLLNDALNGLRLLQKDCERQPQKRAG
jgi:hypothetical protein